MRKAILKKLRRRKCQLEIHEIVEKVHFKFSQSVELSRFEELDPETIREQLRLEVIKAFDGFCSEIDSIVDPNHRDDVVEQVLNESFGLGPLDEVLRDDSVRGVKIERSDHIELDDGSEWQPSGISFRDEDHFQIIMERIRLSGLFRIAELSVVDEDTIEENSMVIVIRRISSLPEASQSAEVENIPEPVSVPAEPDSTQETVTLRVVGFDDEVEG